MRFTIVHTRWFAACWHPCWVPFLWIAEAGVATLQIGPLLLEMSYWS